MIEPLAVLQGRRRCSRQKRSGAAWAIDVAESREAMTDMFDGGGVDSCGFIPQRMVQQQRFR